MSFTRVTILGARHYDVRAKSNADVWKRLLQQIKYDDEVQTLAAKVSDLEQAGVDLPFINYAVRNNYVRPI